MSVMCVDKALLVQRAEKTGAFQVGAHHAGDIGAGLGIAQEIGNGDGERLGIALGHVHLQRSMRGRGRRKSRQRGQQNQKFLHVFSRQ